MYRCFILIFSSFSFFTESALKFNEHEQVFIKKEHLEKVNPSFNKNLRMRNCAATIAEHGYTLNFKEEELCRYKEKTR